MMGLLTTHLVGSSGTMVASTKRRVFRAHKSVSSGFVIFGGLNTIANISNGRFGYYLLLLALNETIQL